MKLLFLFRKILRFLSGLDLTEKRRDSNIDDVTELLKELRKLKNDKINNRRKVK